MKILYINKPDGNDYIVLLMQHKITREWSFVNLTKEHICPCKFKTYEEAIDDLEQHVKDGRVSAWHFVDLPISLYFKK